jgi:hypothetical protein
VGRKPTDVTEVENALQFVSKDLVEYDKNKTELLAALGVERIDQIPMDPDTEQKIAKFIGDRTAPGNKGQFRKKTTVPSTGPSIASGRKGFLEAEASDAQMVARRGLQGRNFKTEGKKLSAMNKDALIARHLGGENAVIFARAQPNPIREQMVEIALLRDAVNADVGETNDLDAWKNRVDNLADRIRGRGPAGQTGKGSVRTEDIVSLRGQGLTTGGNLRSTLFNMRLDAESRKTQATIESTKLRGELADKAKTGVLPPAGATGIATPPPPSASAPAAAPAAAPTSAPAPSTPPGPSGILPPPPGGSGGSTPPPPAPGPTVPPAAAPASSTPPPPGTSAKKASWRDQPVSEAQKASLIRAGIDEAKVPPTRGAASDMIDELATKAGKFEPITSKQRETLLAAGV